MIADKKPNRSKGQQLPEEEPRRKNHDELDSKRKLIREKTKANRVNYIVKDLPIY